MQLWSPWRIQQLLENHLQILTSSTLVKVCTPKTYPILMKILSDLEKSIVCAAVGRIFEILKRDRKIQLLPKNWIFRSFFKISKIRPTAAQTMLFFRSDKIFIKIGYVLGVQTLASVEGLRIWSWFSKKLLDSSVTPELNAAWLKLFQTSYPSCTYMVLIG